MVYLEIVKVRRDRRAAAAEVYQRYKAPFLTGIPGAQSKELLVRDDDVQVLHGFDSTNRGEPVRPVAAARRAHGRHRHTP